MANDPRNQSGGFFGRVQDEFSVKSATAIVGFDFDEALPESQNYIGVDDFLLVGFGGLGSGTAASQRLTVNVRMLGLDGLIHPLTFSAPGTSTRAQTFTPFQLMEGFLLSISCIANQVANTNALTYATVGLTRNPQGLPSIYRVLCAGYVALGQPIGWPEMPPVRAVDGTPWYYRVSQAPAAGADFTFTVPAGGRWRPVCVTGLLTTSVAAANRDVTIVIKDSLGTVVAVIPAGFALIASSSNTYTFGDSLVQSAAFNNVSIAPLPSNLWMTAGYTLGSVTANIQAADQWTNVNIHLGEVLDPA